MCSRYDKIQHTELFFIMESCSHFDGKREEIGVMESSRKAKTLHTWSCGDRACGKALTFTGAALRIIRL
jgi:hypothetical protein